METRTVIEPHPRTTRNESITRWSRGARITLGLITLVPIAILVAAAVTALAPTPIATVQPSVVPLFFVIFLGTFVQFLVILFYLSFAAQNPRTDNRLAWMLGMIALPFATLPIYWWVHVWKAPYVSDPGRDYNVPGGQLATHTD